MVDVVIADDEEFVRYFIRSVLESMSFNVVAEVDKGDELYSVMKELEPDILLLDVNMPNLTGIEFLQKHVGDFPKTCVIILTSAKSAQVTKMTSVPNVKCVLKKDIAPVEMISAIKKVWLECKKEREL